MRNPFFFFVALMMMSCSKNNEPELVDFTCIGGSGAYDLTYTDVSGNTLRAPGGGVRFMVEEKQAVSISARDSSGAVFSVVLTVNGEEHDIKSGTTVEMNYKNR